ncbi:hypothetical protein ABH966_003452 [Lysinibacillus sp. RC46]
MNKASDFTFVITWLLPSGVKAYLGVQIFCATTN